MADFELFGPLRKWSPVQVALGDNMTPHDAKEALIETLKKNHYDFSADNLVRVSALGSDTHVLDNFARLDADGRYAVLPPVAGG